MADAKDKDKEKGEEAEAAPVAAPAKSKKKLFLIIGGLVGLLLLIGAPVTFFMLKSGGDDKAVSTEDGQGTEEGGGTEATLVEDELGEDEEPLGAMFPLETFVVNLSGGRFIRAQIQLEFNEREIPNRFYIKLVPIRDALITLLTKKTFEDLATEEGKLALKKSVRDIINETLKKEDVKQVYFTQFVVQ